MISTRKNRLSGKRAIIKGLHVVTTVEIHAEVEKAEKATAGRKRKRSPVTSRRDVTATTQYREDSEDESDAESIIEKVLEDCIEVAL